jgi:hypothetical protein
LFGLFYLPSLLFCIQIVEKFMHMLGTDRCFSFFFCRLPCFLLLMGSTIFFIVGGFGGCTGLEDCSPTIFSVVLSWLGGFFCGAFFCGGFAVFLTCFGGWMVFPMCFHGWAVFFCGAAVFFCAFDGACFAAIGFFCFFGGD